MPILSKPAPIKTNPARSRSAWPRLLRTIQVAGYSEGREARAKRKRRQAACSEAVRNSRGQILAVCLAEVLWLGATQVSSQSQVLAACSEDPPIYSEEISSNHNKRQKILLEEAWISSSLSNSRVEVYSEDRTRIYSNSRNQGQTILSEEAWVSSSLSNSKAEAYSEDRIRMRNSNSRASNKALWYNRECFNNRTYSYVCSFLRLRIPRLPYTNYSPRAADRDRSNRSRFLQMEPPIP